MSAPRPAPSFPVDGHVHLYECHDHARLFAAAAAAFRAARGADAVSWGRGNFLGALCLTEDLRHRSFALLAEGKRRIAGWTLERTDERESLIVEGAHGERILLLSGFQVVTREGLEVLALATVERPTDRRTIADTVQGIVDTGGLPVLPWAFGKWWFGRGVRLADYLGRSSRPRVYLGDNAGRASGLPGTEPYTLAAHHDLVVLPGTDPLPLAGQEKHAGSYGFLLAEGIGMERPARWFREAVAGLGASPPVIGERGGWARFLDAQLRLRREIGRPRPRGATDGPAASGPSEGTDSDSRR